MFVSGADILRECLFKEQDQCPTDQCVYDTDLSIDGICINKDETPKCLMYRADTCPYTGPDPQCDIDTEAGENGICKEKDEVLACSTYNYSNCPQRCDKMQLQVEPDFLNPLGVTKLCVNQGTTEDDMYDTGVYTRPQTTAATGTTAAGTTAAGTTAAGTTAAGTTAAGTTAAGTTAAGTTAAGTTAAGTTAAGTTAAGTTAAGTTAAGTTAAGTTAAGTTAAVTTSGELRTVTSLEADSSEQISMMEAITKINVATDSMDKNHLEIIRNILDNLINDSDTEEDVLYNIALSNVALDELIHMEKGESFDQSNEISESVEYKILRDNIMYNTMNLSEAELTLIRSVFTNLFNINDDEKRNILSTVLRSVNIKIQRKMAEQRREQERNAQRSRQEIRQRRNQEESMNVYNNTRRSSHQTPADMPTEMSQEELIRRQEEALKQYLNPPSIDNISKYFEAQNVKDLVYNVGAPAKNYMTDIIRPNEVADRSCIKDRRFPREPVEVLASGTPAGAYEFHGVGTMLPKFAYTEVYNDKYY